MASKKIWGLFPKTCFRWNGPLHESLKNIIYFGLEFSRDWSGVDSVIESMRNLFRSFLITYRMFCVVAFVTPYKVHQIPFQKTFEQKRAPEGCSFLRVRLAFPCSAPRGTFSSKVKKLAGPQWQLGGRPRFGVNDFGGQGLGPRPVIGKTSTVMEPGKNRRSRKLEVRIP